MDTGCEKCSVYGTCDSADYFPNCLWCSGNKYFDKTRNVNCNEINKLIRNFVFDILGIKDKQMKTYRVIFFFSGGFFENNYEAKNAFNAYCDAIDDYKKNNDLKEIDRYYIEEVG